MKMRENVEDKCSWVNRNRDTGLFRLREPPLVEFHNATGVVEIQGKGHLFYKAIKKRNLLAATE